MVVHLDATQDLAEDGLPVAGQGEPDEGAKNPAPAEARGDTASGQPGECPAKLCSEVPCTLGEVPTLIALLRSHEGAPGGRASSPRDLGRCERAVQGQGGPGRVACRGECRELVWPGASPSLQRRGPGAERLCVDACGSQEREGALLKDRRWNQPGHHS
eukprot:10628989-Alexandrium_andersonii.AAC.1